MENNKPQIRFKGFDEDWDKKELSSEVDFFSGLTYSPFDIVKSNGTFVIRSSNVKEGRLVNADNVFVKSEKVNCEFVKKNDIAVVVRNGSRDLIGKHAQIKSDINNAVIGAFMTGLRSEIPNFINALLDSEQFKREINKNLGATINQITTGNFKVMKFWFPENQTEQQKIGTFFENLDKLLTEHQQKHNKLQALKKAMLSKMFPQQGQTVPEIRFKGFSGDWIETYLEEIFSFQYGIFNNNPSNGGEYPVYGANGIIGGYTNFNAEDSIVIGHMGEYAGIVLWGKGKHFVTYNGIITKPKNEKLLSEFGYYLLNKMNLRKISDGSGQPFLSYNTLNRIKSSYPKSHDEQNAITQYFKNIDNLITNHEQQINKLQNIKKAFLNKMFI